MHRAIFQIRCSFRQSTVPACTATTVVGLQKGLGSLRTWGRRTSCLELAHVSLLLLLPTLLLGRGLKLNEVFLIHVLKLRWRAFAFAELVKILNWTEFNFDDAYFVWNRTARPVTCARETDDSDWSGGRGELPSDWPITFLKISSRTVQDLNEIIEIFVTRSR